MARIKESAAFLKAFLARPRVIGAVAPSSARLAREVVVWIDWPNVQNVVEYGPGTGIFTEHIQSRLKTGAKFFAIEREKSMVDILGKKFSDVTVYHDSVQNAAAMCDKEGMDNVDAIVSGLPWAAFPEDMQKQFMQATIEVLRAGGQFVTFAYLQGLWLPSGRRFRRMLDENFSEVSMSRTVWLNLPPAIVYRCRR